MALTKVVIPEDRWRQFKEEGISYTNFRDRVGLKIYMREFRGARPTEFYVLCDNPWRAVEFKLKWL